MLADSEQAFNDNDIGFSGIKLDQFPREKEFYNSLKTKLQKFIKASPVKVINEEKDVMHPRDYDYIVTNFVSLYNQNETPIMKIIRKGDSNKQIINMKIVNYEVTFFVEFPDRKSYYGYEIYLQIQRDATKSFNFENSIVNVECIGGVGLSDIEFGVPDNIIEENNMRFYKDADTYGEYKFTYGDKEIKDIIRANSGKEVDEITETDKTGLKKVPVGTNRNIYQDRFQRGKPPTEEPKYVSTTIYTQPSKNTGKLMIGNKCMDVDNSGKIIANNCENVKTQFTYSDKKLHYKDKCVSYHADGDIELLNCDYPTSCKPNAYLNNCMNFKFIKYGGLEIDGNNSCLNPDKNTWLGENCKMSGNSFIL